MTRVTAGEPGPRAGKPLASPTGCARSASPTGPPRCTTRCSTICRRASGGERFAAYMVQDYGFVDPFTALIGHAIGHAPSMADRVVLGQFMGMLTSDENSTFQRTFEAFGVSARADHLPATRDFRHLLHEVGMGGQASASGRYAEILAVLVVTEWLYLAWATRISRTEGLHPLMGEWIDLHDNPDFQAFVDWLRQRLDEEAAGLDDTDFSRMAERFRETVAKELAFHDAVHPCR